MHLFSCQEIGKAEDVSALSQELGFFNMKFEFFTTETQPASVPTGALVYAEAKNTRYLEGKIWVWLPSGLLMSIYAGSWNV